MKPKELKAVVNAIGSPLAWASISTVEDGLIISDLDLFIRVVCSIPNDAVGYVARTNVQTIKQALVLADYDAEQLEFKLTEGTKQERSHVRTGDKEVPCYTLFVGSQGQSVDIEVSKSSIEYPDLVHAEHLDIPLAETLRAQVFASEDNSRNIQGVFLIIGGVVATDGHRLIKIETDVPANVKGLRLNMTNPKKLKLKNFYKMPNDSVFATNDEGTIVARVSVDGQYPDYQRVIPNYKNFEPVELNIAEITKGCLLAKKAPSSEKGFAPIKIIPTGDIINKVEYPFVEPLTVDFKPFGLNAVYLLDVLKDIGKGVETVTMYHEDTPSAAVTFVHNDTVYVVMPMRLTA